MSPAQPADAHPGGGVRVVVAGKGGAGKSTLTALLARILARQGCSVIAVDADEQRNLGAVLGLDPAVAAAVVPLADDAGYVEEKTGARPGGGAGGMLRLNPDVTDAVDRLAVDAPDGVRLLVMGGVRQAGGGCLCPEHSLLAATVSGMYLHQRDVVLMDTHAGVEHFGRALARGFDQAVVVADPSATAVQVAARTARLAADLGIGRIHLALNRVRHPEDLRRGLAHLETLGGFSFASVHPLPHDDAALDTEPSVAGLLDGSPLAQAAGRLAARILSGVG